MWVAVGVTVRAGLNGSGLRGSVELHDPSTIIQCDGRYYIYGTGPGIRAKSSADGVVWMDEPNVFASPPAWVPGVAPGFNGDFWAPDIIYANGRYCLYYSVSSWGSQQSAIGLATSPTLNPKDPNYHWTDQGIVIQSVNGSPYNTIDPAVTFDAAGRLWLCFGSYWNGIHLVELDPVTGLRNITNTTVSQLAYSSAIEAACIYRHGAYYYLFVNWGSCCSGVNSTYNIRVGRSANITGPYRDRNGVDMRNGVGTLFAEASGKFAGPGHAAVIEENGQPWLSYHYYDAGAYAPWYGAYGAAAFDVQPLQFTSDGWPVLSRDWSAEYNFQVDAYDEGGQYYGQLVGGATTQTDATRGRILNLNGAGQAVWLPPGVANARTFGAVVKWNGGDPWQRIFDFGTDTSNYVMLTPSSADGRLRCDIRVNGATQIVQWTNSLPVGVWTAVAVTFDGARATLYVNAEPVSASASVKFLPYQTRAQTNYLGRSKSVADPDFSGQLSSFRVYGRTLSAAEIAAPIPTLQEPAERAVFWPGMTLTFAGSAVDFNDLPMSAGQLTWRVEEVSASATNLVFGPVSGVLAGSCVLPTNIPTGTCYRVELAATNAAGFGRVISRDLARGTASSVWSSYYPFTSNAQDASNHFHGTFAGGAGVVTDPERGPVARLLGTKQYINLPSGASAADTISGWVKWNGGGDWQRFFDFGAGTSSWLFFSPKDSSGRFHCAITLDRSRYVRVIQGPTSFPVNEWVHVAAVFDGRQGIIYTNGQAAAIHHSVNLLPQDLQATKVYLGRSQYSIDPYFNGRFDAVRLHSRPLSPVEIFGPQLNIQTPAPGLLVAGGDVVAFSGMGWDYTEAGLSPSALNWSVDFIREGNITPILGPLAGVTNGVFPVPTTIPDFTNGMYQVQLTGTSANGLSVQRTVALAPQLVSLALSTVPEGLTLEFESQSVVTPTNFLALAGMERIVHAPTPQNSGAGVHDFVLWSDGGGAMHSIKIPITNSALTASFVAPTIGLTHDNEILTLSWPDWAGRLQLVTTTNLVAPVIWHSITNSVYSIPDGCEVQLPTQEAQQFFRLQAF